MGGHEVAGRQENPPDPAGRLTPDDYVHFEGPPEVELSERYWLRTPPQVPEWWEVDKATYVRVERFEGFTNMAGRPDEPATSFFTGRHYEGTTLPGTVAGHVRPGNPPVTRIPEWRVVVTFDQQANAQVLLTDLLNNGWPAKLEGPFT